MNTLSIKSAYDCAGHAEAIGHGRQDADEGLGARAARVGLALVDVLLAWQERARTRGQLARLDDRMLRDIGVSRADAEVEVSKPFWRA